MEIANKLVTLGQLKWVNDQVFTVKTVEQLPGTGEASVFYLVPKSGGSGYDKYWWIEDENGNAAWDKIGGSSTLVVSALPQTGEEDIDYILQSSAGCLFYKWIDGGWHIVAGSIAKVVAALPAVGNEFTDYYVPNDSGKYLHYRWLGNAFHLVGADAYSKTEINEMLSEVNGAISDVDDKATEALDNTEEMLDSKIDGAYVEDGYLYLTSNGNVVVGHLGPFSGAGGGGGSTNNAVFSAVNDTGWTSASVANGGSCPIRLTWSSVEEGAPTGDGTVKITVGGAVRAMLNVSQGTVTIDLAPYCVAGDNRVSVTVSDVYDNSRTVIFRISCIDISLSSSFDASTPYQGVISFPYIPVGNVAKTLHFVLDGEEIGTNSTSVSGRQISFTIPQQSHGPHTFEVYFDCEINGQRVESNHLYYEIICIAPENTAPIIVSDFAETTAVQYTTLHVPYTVYDPQRMTADVVITMNGSTAAQLTVDRTQQVFTYRADNIGRLTIVITSGGASKAVELDITKSDVQAEAATDRLALYLTSAGRSNNEPNPGVWHYGDIEAAFSHFNYSSDGWVNDDDGITVLRVAGDARVTIPYQLFASDFRSTGKTIELEFATHDVMDYDAEIISCMSGGRGFSLTAQLARLASEQSEIAMQYKENEHVRVSFVVEKRSQNRLMYIYVNGIMSGAVQYPDNDDFAQATPVDISIGSNDCTTDIYCIRVYDNNLERHQILDNWIADTRNVTEMLERYKRNDVYDEYGSIVIDKLPSELPYLIIECGELPQYKGDKKTVNVTYVDPVTPARSFTATGAEANVQGTSSQYYARKNYKIKFKNGFDMNNGTHVGKYPLRPGAVATNAFCYKADVASSEGANNVELARLYNDICPYKTPPQQSNSAVRQGIDGFPIVIFWANGTETTFLGKYNFNNDKGTEEVFGFEEGDESWEIKNNTSNRVIWKSADFESTYFDDESKTEKLAWLNDFEARYPEENTNAANLKKLAEWLVSTDRSAVSTEAEKAARLQKFKTELPQYMEKDAVIFYYLFTELFLMVDSRAKNAFPSFLGGGKWFSLPYDFDTALGINNEGALVFSYNLEDTDTLEGGAEVFNGQQSVLWNNLRDAFREDIMAMYQNLRSTGALSYAKVEEMFETHQNTWGEAVFNEDAYFKYLQPLIHDGSGIYLSMLQGSKAEQRKWWLYNRFRYLDSKYNAGDALTDVVQFRSYAKGNITVTPYADIYASVKYGSYLQQARAERNKSYTFASPDNIDEFNDTETYIYSASQLASVGDLSGLKIGTADFSVANKLQSLKVGDGAAGYNNSNLKGLTLGNNVLLKVLDVRNCSALGTEEQKSVDISGCTNIEEIYFDGTSVTGVALPNGGIIKKLHLPATVTNLTIRNQTAITEFVMPSYSNISTLWLDNVSGAVDEKAILRAIPAGSRVRLANIYWEAEDAEEIGELFDILDTMRGQDEGGGNMDIAQVFGTIHTNALTGAEIADFNTRYPYVNVVADHTTSYLRYYNYDGSELLYTETILDGGNGTYQGTPSRSATAQYSYAFAGWSRRMDSTAAEADACDGITADRNVYAAYTATVRTYTVAWKDYDGTVLETDTDVPYGTTPSYDGAALSRSTTAQYTYTFVGWSKNMNASVADADITAKVEADVTFYAAYSGTVRTYTVYWKDYNGTTLETDTNVPYGTTPTYNGATPSRSTTAQYTYTFAGWSKSANATTADSDALAAVTGNKTLYAAYTATLRSYTVKFYNGSTLMQTVTAKYGTTAAYTGSTLTKTSVDDASVYTFANWSPSNTNITGDRSCYARFKRSDVEETITDSWDTIIANVNNGTYKTKYAIGDTKQIDLGTEVVAMQIAAIDTDTLASGSGTAAITWISQQVLKDKHRMNPSYSGGTAGTGSLGGWVATEMRSYLKDTIKPKIPSEVRAAIKTVKKYSRTYDASEKLKNNVESNDDVWIPSIREMGYDYTTSDYEQSGPCYNSLFPNTDARRKTSVGDTIGRGCWTRSAHATNSFKTHTNGYIGATSQSYYIALGFCI